MIALVEGRRAPEDAQRDRAEHPAGRPDDRLPDCGRHAAAVRDLFGRAAVAVRADLAAGLPHPDDDRRAAVGDRHRRHGSAGPAQRAGDVRAAPSRRRATCTRCSSTRPARSRSAIARRREFIPLAGISDVTRGRRCAARVAAGRNPGGAFDRRARKGEVRPARPRAGAAAGDVRAVHRADAHVWRRPVPRRGSRLRPAARAQRIQVSARSAKALPMPLKRWVSTKGGKVPRTWRHRRTHRSRRRHAAGGRRRSPCARRHPPEGHRQGRHPRALRASARHGHQDGDDHRRQPADGRGHRRPRPAWTTSWRRRRPKTRWRSSSASRRRETRGDDRRRHQRRPGARPGRRRRGDEHRHAGGEGSRQHGRPRLEPDQADRDRGDRQAAPDHARRADHVLDRQRRRQVLRDHPGHVPGDVPDARRAQHHGTAARRSRRSCRR